eukprot:c49051_g1_i1.p1 GENE.c49051_g1_i1~~c49051_g1_i1.p1  ORF type:complete len:286 (+),score=54.42 c49051_g1_i1:42-860(+)
MAAPLFASYFKKGETKATADLPPGTLIGLYFSAHWCPPCKQFTPVLARTYENLQRMGKAVEFIFVSSDRSQKDFDGYYGSMPWAAIPFAESETRQALGERFGVRGIPTFIICTPSGEIVCAEGRSAVAGDPLGANFPWGVVPGGAYPKIPLSEALGRILTAEEDAALTALQTLATVAGNVIANPGEDKYRTLKAGNKAVQKKILGVSGGGEALLALGFAQDGDSFVLEPTEDAWSVLVAGKATIDEALMALTAAADDDEDMQLAAALAASMQ